ncbi:MAG: Uncharacterised protein [Polaribacter sejongensis]|nr:MAG: Uncharacterised protein [Polaribacter sejongensis]
MKANFGEFVNNKNEKRAESIPLFFNFRKLLLFNI